MPKITFMGAGSTIFARNELGECMLTPALQDSHIALYDIDAKYGDVVSLADTLEHLCQGLFLTP